MSLNAIQLTRNLLAFDTTNPPGNEAAVMNYLGGLLQEAGFQVNLMDYLTPQRKQMVARLHSSGKHPAIALTGHLDTMPRGEFEWSHDLFGGETNGDRLYGRGSSDMKSGVAAMVVAAIAAARQPRDSDILLILTADEEIGCGGAQQLIAQTSRPILPANHVGLLVVGEPTSNEPFWGHKGVLWLRGVCIGQAAHASVPEYGINAICKAARAVLALERFHAENRNVSDPSAGRPTVNVGTIQGGKAINCVPDRATIEVDIRTVPGSDWSHERIRQELAACTKEHVNHWETITDVAGVRSDPTHPWPMAIRHIVSTVTGQTFGAEERLARYFTDASFLVPALGHLPVVILGPGDLAQAHAINESCSLSAIEQATRMYTHILEQGHAGVASHFASGSVIP